MKNAIRRRPSLIVLLVVGVMSIGAVASNASASFSQCNSNNVCIWGNNDFNWFLRGISSGTGLTALSGSANNQMDSWANRTARTGAGHDYSNGSGDCQTWGAGTRDNNVNPANSDEVSSIRANRGC